MTEKTKPTVKQETAEQSKAAKARPSSQPSSRQWSKVKIFGWLITAAVLIAVLLAAQFYWQHDRKGIQVQLKELSDAIGILEKNDNRHGAQLIEQVHALAELEKQVANLHRTIEAQGKQLQELSLNAPQDLMLTEALHLTRQASRRLQIEHSSKIPMALLENADAILRRMENADLNGAREILARDLNALGQAVNVDIEGVFLELVALAGNIDQLPMIKLTSAPEQVIDGSEFKVADNSELLDYLSESLSQLVRIRQHYQPIAPLMLPGDQAIVRHNIAILFQQAQAAVLRGQQTIYSYCLDQIASNLGQHFKSGDQLQALQQRLDKLAQIQIVRQLPQIQDSVSALETLVQQRHSSQLNISTEGTQP